ncbi:glycosyltransferase family 2 protein [Pseudomonas oryzihabitans]|uniref:glycosyltransferase family 2 protein n=1 Tax=Pseudomonas oryzihabitans TaxID=47885 RepID=UPI00111D28CA|nr:galactosyltransferase-related protein [Pseudomonas psychrotolerans]QDD90717.1 glycosyl transferase [Pseudomonas psychrotolerans]
MIVLTLVHGRERQLANLIRGLELAPTPPTALVVVQMNEAPRPLHSAHFPIQVLGVMGDGILPLAAARNTAVAAAPGEELVFLDVDCIPAPDLLDGYRQALAARPEALHQGFVHYLPAGVAEGEWTPAELLAKGVVHPLHRNRPPGAEVPHPLFWSLNFACRRATFQRIGGFDEGYRGYGGEDTDFAFRAREAEVPVYQADARAFHQYHPTYHPPLNHFASILANARRFQARWGMWPMDGWLHDFAAAGYIHFDESRGIEELRVPSTAEIAACRDASGSGF